MVVNPASGGTNGSAGRFASRTTHLKPEGAYQVLARAQELEAQGKRIIHLEIGQPDFETFDHIRLAGKLAIDAGQTRYTPPAGMKALREVIAEDAGRRHNLHIHPDQVVVSPGAKPNLFFPTLALIEPGDEVLYPNPGFPTYEAMIKVAGGVPIPVPLLEGNNFSFDLAAFHKLLSPRTRLVILNSPANPTGGVMPLSDLQEIARAAEQHDFWVISDEIYMRLVYDGLDAPSIASLPGMQSRTIIVDGFSKTYAMTGWRLGYGIMPKELAQAVQLLLTHSVGCTAQFTQLAGIAALSGPQDEVNAMLSQYQLRRDLLVDGLNRIPGIICRRPQGAFYVFPNIKALGKSSSELANHLLEHAGVAALAGSDFGSYGEGYLRLTYSCSIETIHEAVELIARAVSSLV
ncbi:MAG: aspartate aminotransferase [Anaerolineales bacterium]|nr:pyridoxal phosphate-dependent aminotransferase [Anaerolineae bacterium]PWB55858.1 MAG: aspartate aminotransferase [Anaerolineales bacterium]